VVIVEVSRSGGSVPIENAAAMPSGWGSCAALVDQLFEVEFVAGHPQVAQRQDPAQAGRQRFGPGDLGDVVPVSVRRLRGQHEGGFAANGRVLALDPTRRVGDQQSGGR